MMKEEAVRFGQNQSLVGILTLPDHPAPTPAVVLLNAGMIHRVGPSRIYVRLARRLAAQGTTVLRFDFSGIGESAVRTDSLSVEQVLIADVRQATDYLAERFNIAQFILMGHCNGAWMALVGASEDARVTGAVLMNPEGGEEEWVEYDRQRKTSRYYENYYSKEALLDSERWKKLLTGKADYRSLLNNVMRNIVWYRISAAVFKLRQRRDSSGTKPEPQAQNARKAQILGAILQYRPRLLFAFSKGSSAIEHTHVVIGKELEQMVAAGIVTEVVIPNADHTFTMIEGQQSLIHHIETWCRPVIGEPVREPSN